MNNQQQDAPLEYYFDKYRELAPQDAEKRTGLVFDAENSRFEFRSLGFKIYVLWPEFELVPDEPGRCPKPLLGFGMKILAVRYLLEGVNMPSHGGFKSYRELPWGEVYDRNFQGRCIKRLAFGFGAKLDEFSRAAEKLGGVRLGLGDASYDMPFFEDVVCRLILWSADEEFPPSAQFLFSDNTPFAFNAEDLAAAGDIIIDALKEANKLSDRP